MKTIKSITESGREIQIVIAEDPSPAKVGGGAVAGGTAVDVVQRLEEVGATIADVCTTLQGRIMTVLGKSKPSELTLEFSLTLAGETGLPLITKASAEGTFQVSAKWDFTKEASHV